MARWHINQDYFNLEQITGEDLKSRYYVLGAFYPCYTHLKVNGMTFTSTKRDLVKIVKQQLESINYIICYSSSNSHALRIKNVPKLVSKLEELGLEADKFKRKFPEYIKEPYIDHFIRGFIDAQGVIFPTPDGTRLNLGIKLNRKFDAALNEVLRKYAFVQHQTNLQAIHIIYGFGDTMRILEFVYRDWNFIRENGLYLSKNYDWFKSYKETYPRENHQKRAARERIEKFKELLLENKEIWSPGHKRQVAEDLSYKKTKSLKKAFKRLTGITINEFLNTHLSIEAAKRLFRRGKRVGEVAEELGFTDSVSLNEHFRRVTGKELDAFLREEIIGRKIIF